MGEMIGYLLRALGAGAGTALGVLAAHAYRAKHLSRNEMERYKYASPPESPEGAEGNGTDIRRIQT